MSNPSCKAQKTSYKTLKNMWDEIWLPMKRKVKLVVVCLFKSFMGVGKESQIFIAKFCF
jgi:hypothetical protein